MPDGVGIRVVGLAQLRRDLRAVDRKWGPELGKTNFQVASVVVAEAERRAPRGVHQGGGKVAPISSTITALRRQQAAAVSIGGTRSPHAEVIEFGGNIPRRGSDPAVVTRARQHHKSFRRAGVSSLTHVAAQPYLYPAIDATRERVVNMYGLLLDRLLGRVFNQ